MLRLGRKAVFLGFIFAAVVSLTDFSGKCDGINDKIFRFHVLANSNSEEDQELKFKVRDSVLLYCSQFIKEDMKKDDVKEVIRMHMDDIKKLAEDEIKKNGYDYSVKLEMCDDAYFNNRNYNTVTIPAGNYQAIRVIIGEGRGNNWWCVMFPPMCLPAAEEREELENVLNDGQMDLVENLNHYEVKFKIWEGFISLKNFTVNLFNNSDDKI